MTLRTTMRGAAIGAVAAAALGGGVLAGLAPAASAQPVTIQGTCGDTFDPSTSGGKAYWEVQCGNGNVRISGWVKDTDADGQCAKVKARYSNGSTWFSRAACPKGEVEHFTSPYRSGDNVRAYLYEYDV